LFEGYRKVLTNDEVIWGHRYILGRDPESTAVLDQHMRAYPDWRNFRQALLNSSEFAGGRIDRAPESKWVATSIFGGERLIWLDLADSFVSRGCLFDGYEPIETALVRQHLTAGDVFLDIGANIGWFSLLASTIIGPSGHVHAFEPRTPTVEYLRRSISMNGLESAVTVHALGLDSADSEQFLGSIKGTSNAGHSIIMSSASQDGIESIPIHLVALDTLNIPKVDFVKIDVEGAEMRVLEGGATTISRNRPIVLSEIYPDQLHRVSRVSPTDYFAWFLSKGYRAFIADTVRTGEEIADFPTDWHKELMNVLFLPNPV
jgi:FkbM family methyltransferase